MGDVESVIVYFRKPNMTTETHRPKHRATVTSCSHCGAHLQTYCELCSSTYASHDTLYDCGNCGAPKNMYCELCGAPQTLEHFYYRSAELQQ